MSDKLLRELINVVNQSISNLRLLLVKHRTVEKLPSTSTDKNSSSSTVTLEQIRTLYDSVEKLEAQVYELAKRRRERSEKLFSRLPSLVKKGSANAEYTNESKAAIYQALLHHKEVYESYLAI